MGVVHDERKNDGAGGKNILAKGGFTGCFMVGDATAKKAVVFLSNRVYPERPVDLEPWQEFRRNVVRCIFSPLHRRKN